MPFKYRVTAVESVPLRGGNSSLAASVDAPHFALAKAASLLPMPPLKPREAARLRIELTLPDGSTSQQFASIALVSPIDAPGVLALSGLAVSEVPIGTGVELLGFDAHPR